MLKYPLLTPSAIELDFQMDSKTPLVMATPSDNFPKPFPSPEVTVCKDNSDKHVLKLALSLSSSPISMAYVWVKENQYRKYIVFYVQEISKLLTFFALTNYCKYHLMYIIKINFVDILIFIQFSRFSKLI